MESLTFLIFPSSLNSLGSPCYGILLTFQSWGLAESYLKIFIVTSNVLPTSNPCIPCFTETIHFEWIRRGKMDTLILICYLFNGDHVKMVSSGSKQNICHEKGHYIAYIPFTSCTMWHSRHPPESIHCKPNLRVNSILCLQNCFITYKVMVTWYQICGIIIAQYARVLYQHNACGSHFVVKHSNRTFTD